MITRRRKCWSSLAPTITFSTLPAAQKLWARSSNSARVHRSPSGDGGLLERPTASAERRTRRSNWLQAGFSGPASSSASSKSRVASSSGAARPISVSFTLATGGPKGNAVAHELVDSVFVTSPIDEFERCSVLTFGTVLDDGEDPGSERPMAAAGHAAALMYHGLHLRGAAASLPNGAQWLAALNQIPEREQHLALHEGHVIEANDRDRLAITGDTLTTFGLARTALAWLSTWPHNSPEALRRSPTNLPVRTSSASCADSWKPRPARPPLSTTNLLGVDPSWKVDVTLALAGGPLTNHRTIDEAELGAAAVHVRYGGRTLGTYGQDLRSFSNRRYQ